MSREIKFRGKSVDSGKWVYGWYAEFEGSPVIYAFDNPWSDIFVISETVGQYTGREDICGHDIITFLPKDGCTKTRQKGIVYYNEKRTAFCVKDTAFFIPDYSLASCKDIEVIGNIHENPELGA